MSSFLGGVFLSWYFIDIFQVTETIQSSTSSHPKQEKMLLLRASFLMEVNQAWHIDQGLKNGRGKPSWKRPRPKGGLDFMKIGGYRYGTASLRDPGALLVEQSLFLNSAPLIIEMGHIDRAFSSLSTRCPVRANSLKIGSLVFFQFDKTTNQRGQKCRWGLEEPRLRDFTADFSPRFTCKAYWPRTYHTTIEKTLSQQRIHDPSC